MNVNIDGADMRIHRIWAGIAILALTLAAYANSPSALAQAGSTGGTIGKQGENLRRAAPHQRKFSSLRKGISLVTPS